MFPRDVTFTVVRRLEVEAGEDVAFRMDEDTFRAFYERTARGLLGYLTRLTGDRQHADDLLQETYYRFLRAAAVHENDTHRRNSLYRIATNLARDAHRRRLVRPWATESSQDVADRTDAAGRFEQRTDVRRAMGRLKPRERAMLWLAYAEGSSHREIAAALGLQAGSIKLLLFRARRKLAALLGRGHEQTMGERS